MSSTVDKCVLKSMDGDFFYHFDRIHKILNGSNAFLF